LGKKHPSPHDAFDRQPRVKNEQYNNYEDVKCNQNNFRNYHQLNTFHQIIIYYSNDFL
jgi:hypothetical protein